jgi:hypothetical protein
VNWGDGTSAESLSVANTRSAGAGQCTVDLQGPTHRYVLSRPQPYDIVVTVGRGGLTGSGHREVQVIDVPFRGEAEALSAVAGQQLSTLVGEIRDDNEFSTVGQFSAVIDWGDGTAPTPATLAVDRPGRYDVAGTHTYASAGTYSLVISVTHAGQTVPLVPATVTVAPTPGGGPGPGPGLGDPTNPLLSPTFQLRNARARLSTLRRRGVTLRIGLGAFTGRTLRMQIRATRQGRVVAIGTARLRLRGARVVDAGARIVDVRWRPAARLVRRLRGGTSYGLRVSIAGTTLQDTFRPRRG